MKSNIEKIDYKKLIPFNDSALPNQKGLMISIEKSEKLEKIIMPQIEAEIAKLRISKPHLFYQNSNNVLADNSWTRFLI